MSSPVTHVVVTSQFGSGHAPGLGPGTFLNSGMVTTSYTSLVHDAIWTKSEQSQLVDLDSVCKKLKRHNKDWRMHWIKCKMVL